MNPRDFLDLAEKLAREWSEAEWRTAVGRAYYSAFLTAKEFMTDLGFRVPREQAAHRYLVFRLSNCGQTDVKRAGQTLDAMRTERNLADYDLRYRTSSGWARRTVADAEWVLDALAGLEPADRDAVRGAIRTYERDTIGDVTFTP